MPSDNIAFYTMRSLTVFILFWVGFVFNGYASDACFNKVLSQECFDAHRSGFKDRIYQLEKLKGNEKILFINQDGLRGFLNIIAVENDSKTCSLTGNIDYQQTGQITRVSRTLKIDNYLGVWGSTSFVDLPELSSNKFELNWNAKKKKCQLTILNSKKISTENRSFFQENNKFILITALILIAIAAFIMARNVFAEESSFQAASKFDDESSEAEEIQKSSLIYKYSKPFFKRYFVPVVSGMRNKKGIETKYKQKLANAGLLEELTFEELYAYKLFLIIGFPLVFLFLRFFLETDWSFIFLPVVSGVGFYYPDIWLKSKIDTRKEEIDQNLPFIVDMLALSVEAGLDFVIAMSRVIEKAPSSEMSREFSILIREIKLGSTRVEALRQLAWRVDTNAVTSFCATLIAADQVGASISGILKDLSNELRGQRSSVIEKKGAQATTKLLFPMMMLIFPAIVLIILAPIVGGLL